VDQEGARTNRSAPRRQRPDRGGEGLRSLRDARTLGRFVRNLKEGVYITDVHGRILDANPAFLAMFGVTSLAQLRSITAADLLVEPARRAEELAILAREGSVREFEFTIRTPGGQVRTVLDTAYQVTDPDNGEILYHGILVDITDRKRLEEQLREMAIRDSLTGCYNRFFLRELESRTHCRWGVVAVDIDGFKAYNDEHGHDTGDRVLAEVARFLLARVRKEDAVVRTGGDEFVLLLAGGSTSETQAVGRRLSGSGRARPPVPLSVGWAVQGKGERLEEAIRRADHDLLARRARARDFQAVVSSTSAMSRASATGSTRGGGTPSRSRR